MRIGMKYRCKKCGTVFDVKGLFDVRCTKCEEGFQLEPIYKYEARLLQQKEALFNFVLRTKD